MKGRNTFTHAEAEVVKKLISEKVIATRDKQKSIRDKIRKIGFYYSDFSSDKEGYTVASFETLIRSGQIKISDTNSSSNSILTIEVPKNYRAIKPQSHPIKASYTLKSILRDFTLNRFNPSSDSASSIPDSPGNYILCLREGSQLPSVSVSPILKNFEGLQVLYTGIASKSLRKRDYHHHFKGNNAGTSTLRKSLGALFGYKQIPRDKNPNSGKTKFSPDDEAKLSAWMNVNLVMFFLPNQNFEQMETELINHFNPPLNLKGNSNPVNADFRALLSRLRRTKD